MKTHLMLAALALLGPLAFCSVHAQPPTAVPQGATAQKIVVQSVTGKVEYTRNDQVFKVQRSTELTQGDKVVVQLGAVCKLVLQHPKSGAPLAAAIIEGYSKVTIAEAYEQNGVARTKLEIPQGVIRAGVVRTAVPPSFVIVTANSVTAVQGTEIRQIETSRDRGDEVNMGRVGVVMVHNDVPHFRSVRAGQSTEIGVETDRRGGELLRAIEAAVLDRRVLLTGPYRRGLEVDFDRKNPFDLFEFPGDHMSGAIPGSERLDGSLPKRPCTNCRGNSGR